MHLIRGASITVSDIARSQALYCDALRYQCVESGMVSLALAKSWGAPHIAGQAYAILQPQSGADVFIRLIEQPPVADYRPLRSYGWAAIEICTQDTDTVNTLMQASDFDIIGPPKVLDGMPAIYPMQVMGPDQEIIYLTEIRANMDEYDLPRAQSLIDQLFILVMACSDMEAAGRWLETHLLIEKGRSVEIIYSMINQAFALPSDTVHALATLKHDRDVCLEIDQYPQETIVRPQQSGWLPPCTAIGSFIHPEFDRLVAINEAHWITPPRIMEGRFYEGKRAGTLRGPDNILIEVIEA